MNTGLQLYTVRDFMAKDFYGTIKKVAEIGYKGVEFAGYFDEDPKEIRKFIDDLGLTCCSSHVGGPTEENVEKECETLKILGTDKFVANIGWDGTGEGFKKTFEKFQKSVEMTKQYGIKLYIHNHWWEHEAKPFGKPFFEYVLENIPELMSECDLGWTLFSGYDPLERVEKYNDKIGLLHCKDCNIKDVSTWAGGTIVRTKLATQVANGDGSAKIKECVAASKADWAIVELDQYDGCMWEAVEKSYKYLTETCNCK